MVTEPDSFATCSDALADSGFTVTSASLMQVPDVRNNVAAENAKGFLKMLELLDDCEDVQAVHHNGDIAEDVLRDLCL